MTEWIGETFVSDTGWDHLERLVDIGNRMAGSDGEREALDATRDALTNAGARNAHLESFDIQGWVRGESRLDAGETTQDCIALPRSPAGEVTGDLVDLKYGLPADFENTDLDGAIVMVSSTVPDYHERMIHRREKYYRAVEAGAAGFVFANHIEGCLPPTGSVGTQESPIGDVPAVGVSKEVGARLSRRFEGKQVTIDIDCKTPTATSANVHADLGPDTEEAVWLTCHVDAHDISDGAMDNGAGTATMLEVARALAQREADLETRVHLACFGAEEVGLVGSNYAADRAELDAIKALVNVDSNVAGRTLTVYTHGFDDLELAAEAVAADLDHPVRTIPEQLPHSDHWPFVCWGVPGYMVSSESDTRGRGWGHTFADTLDKLEPRTLREQAIILTELVVELAAEETEVARQSPDEIVAALEDQKLAEGMKVTGDWPYNE